MGAINLGWYALNETRDYPIDDSATAVDDAGGYLPQDLIVDMFLRYPDELGDFPFIGAVSLSPNLVTVVLEVGDDPDSPGQLFPLAVIGVPRPFPIHRHVVLQPQIEGVGGWIVLGNGAQNRSSYHGRFSTPRQGLLTARSARRYKHPPLRGLKVLHAAEVLTGLVTLKADPPLEIVADSREIDSITRDVIVVRLKEEDRLGRSVFEDFVGPCGTRPESGNCGGLPAVEFVNSVGPDCDGTITFDFSGCAVVTQIEEPCGIVLECQLGLGDACRAPFLPDADGFLPSEVEPAPISTTTTTTTTTPPPAESISIIGELPFLHCFDDFIATDFDVRQGVFSFAEDDSPEEMCSFDESISFSGVVSSYAAVSLSDRNISTWSGFDETSLSRRITTDLKMPATDGAVKHNADVIVNFRPHATLPGRFVHWSAGIDFETQTFFLRYFNGTVFVPIASVALPGLALDKWYRVVVTVNPGDPGQVAITAELTALEQTMAATIGPVTVNNFFPSSGEVGLGSDRATALFSFILVERI